LAIIEVKDLSIQYSSGRKSVNGCTFSIEEGEVFGLLGSNGAGKSTILKTFAGINKHYDGQMKILGKDTRAENNVFRQVAYVPQHPCLYRDFTVKENLFFFASMEGLSDERKNRRIKDLLESFALDKFSDAPAGTLSGGYAQLLNIALSSLVDKKIILLDEPTAGLDLWAKKMVVHFIKSLKRNGKTVILTTHDLDEAEDICDRAVILAEGKIAGQGNIRELLLEMGGGYTVHFYLQESIQLKSFKLKHSPQFAAFDKHIVIQSNPKDVGLAIKEVVTKLEKAGAEISSIDVREPSLSYVFSTLISRGKKE
jgi:ABC-2 type transport system ATP-binding protein